MKIIKAISSFLRKKKETKPVIAKFKVKVAGEEIVEVQLTGKTPLHVASLTNRLKESLDIRFKNGQYVTMKTDEAASKAFEEADRVFKQVENLYVENLYKKKGY